MLQVPRGQALYIERIRRLKALVLGKNMDKKKVADQIMYFVCWSSMQCFTLALVNDDEDYVGDGEEDDDEEEDYGCEEDT